MLDVTEQLQRYATALGDAVPEKGNVPDRRRQFPFRPVAAAAAVVVIAVAVWALIAGTVDGDDSRVATQSWEQVFVPASGASPQQLADGTPVWVVRHDDGSVSVLDAVSTHRPFGAGNLVGWCESSRGFLDPMYGSMYDERGRKQGGPAPRGLDRYPVTSAGGDTATVTGAPSAPPRPAEGGPEAAKPAGPHCFDEDDYVGRYIPGTFEMHELASVTPMTVAEAMRQPDGTLVVVDAPVLIADDTEPLVCTSKVVVEPPRCDGVPAPGLFAHDDRSVVIEGVFIARPRQGTLTDIAYVSARTGKWPG